MCVDPGPEVLLPKLSGRPSQTFRKEGPDGPEKLGPDPGSIVFTLKFFCEDTNLFLTIIHSQNSD
jgi:hypothetical protein